MTDSSTLAVTMLLDAVRNPSPAGARRVCGQIAILLGDARKVEDCRAEVETALQPDDREYALLIDLVTTIQHLLAHPELIEGNHGSIVETHREEALRKVGGTGAKQRIESAPELFLATHDPSRIAALSALMDDIPAGAAARVTVEGTETRGRWIVHVVTHDRPALLATITDVLRRHRLNIVAADLATWPDGAVLDSFVVDSDARPPESELESQVSAHLRRFPFGRRRIAGRAGLTVELDNSLHPTNSILHITGPDRPGLLWRVASGFHRTGIEVHHARIETVDGIVNDRFEVTRADGNRLDERELTRLARVLR